MPKCSLTRRNYVPGQHGQKRTGRLTDYALQLHEKQKAKIIYIIDEQQLRRLISSGKPLLEHLERRLDSVVYRLGMAASRRQARQLVVHGKIIVDGKKVTSPSFLTGKNNIIKLTKKIEKLSPGPVPGWLKIDKTKFEGKVINLPEIDDLPTEINPQLITEYYRR